jgi:hypothetical protein
MELHHAILAVLQVSTRKSLGLPILHYVFHVAVERCLQHTAISDMHTFIFKGLSRKAFPLILLRDVIFPLKFLFLTSIPVLREPTLVVYANHVLRGNSA